MLRRIIDVFGSGALLLLTAPIFLLTTLAIWVDDCGAIFFRQIRAGLHDHPFELLKFRSMRPNNLPTNDDTEIREGHPLVTPVGRLIRRFKIDELPQLINVLRGDMSLIGPRPNIPEEVRKYTPFQRRRANIRPGLTGWAQINGGIEISWPERILLDVWYVEHRSLLLDAQILWRTMGVILLGEKANVKALQQAAAYADQELAFDNPIETQSLHQAGQQDTDAILASSVYE